MKKEWIEAKDIPQQYFEVGQTVYSSMYGEGIVNSILGNHETYPILVDFNNKTTRISYTLEGRRTLDEKITLSQSPIPPIINTPLIKFEEGEIVFAYIGDCWMLCHYYQPVGDLFAVYKSFQKEKLLYAREVRKITDIPLPLKL